MEKSFVTPIFVKNLFMKQEKDFDNVISNDSNPLEIIEKDLVLFGNYLLKKVHAKAHGLDGDVYGQREVTDGDLKNWIHERNMNGY